MGGTGKEMGGTVELDQSGNIYTAGIFTDTAYFDNIMLTNGTKKDWYLAKYDNNGNVLWAEQAHISGSVAYFGSTAITPEGNIYALGTFSGDARFGDHSISASSSNEMFLVRYNSVGQCLGVTSVPNTSHGDITIGSDECAVITGTFSKTVSFGSHIITSYGSNDIFIAKHDAITSVAPKTIQDPHPQLSIFSNPTTGKCTVTIPQEFLHEKQLTLQVFDFQGKLIEKTAVNLAEGKISLNLEAQAKRVY
jgi:hypothetical protein